MYEVERARKYPFPSLSENEIHPNPTQNVYIEGRIFVSAQSLKVKRMSHARVYETLSSAFPPPPPRFPFSSSFYFSLDIFQVSKSRRIRNFSESASH